MKEQFVTYEIALALKELGFDEKCFVIFFKGILNNGHHVNYISNEWESTFYRNKTNSEANSIDIVSAPLWQQVIDFFREKHDIDIEIHSSFGSGGWWWANLCYNPTRTEVLNIARFENYNEARKQAILKAIELCKEKQ